jgi:hypothetical protein
MVFKITSTTEILRTLLVSSVYVGADGGDKLEVGNGTCEILINSPAILFAPQRRLSLPYSTSLLNQKTVLILPGAGKEGRRKRPYLLCEK